MEIRTLTGVETKVISHAFNTAFSDYFIPLQLTIAQLEAKMAADKTNLDLSVGVFEKGQLVAFILHGFDRIGSKKVVYNGGTGVIREKRGAGLTKQMYQFILPKLVNKGVESLVLEVIKENKAAIRSYEKSGFRVKRQLLCYKAENLVKNFNTSIDLKKLAHFDWEEMQSFWDISPTWQNSKSVVNARQEDYLALGTYLQDKFIGYVVFNPKKNRILQIAVHKSYRKKGVGSALLVEIQKEYGKNLSIINVDVDSNDTNEFFKGNGFEKELEQLEMELRLSNNYIK